MTWKLPFVFALSAALAAMPVAARDSTRSYEVWQTAEVVITAEGQVASIRWLDERPGAHTITDRIEPHVRTWQFVPGSIDGTPQRTRTFLNVQVLAEVDGPEVALRIGKASTGPRAAHRVIPRYPRSSARAGISALVTVVQRVAADGTVELESIETSAERRTHAQDLFIEATRSALAQWTYEPERVGGRDVAARVRIPIEFCAPGTDCSRLRRDQAGADVAGQPDRPGEPVALESAVRLLTVVEGEAI